MKTVFVSAVLCALGLAGGGTPSFQDECYQIKAADMRNFCIATTKRSPDHCYRIKDTDRQRFCLAVAHSERGRCHSIIENDLKHLCLAMLPEPK